MNECCHLVRIQQGQNTATPKHKPQEHGKAWLLLNFLTASSSKTEKYVHLNFHYAETPNK